jgi:hypothetical protein
VLGAEGAAEQEFEEVFHGCLQTRYAKQRVCMMAQSKKIVSSSVRV